MCLKSSSLSQAREITVLSKIDAGDIHLRRLSAADVERKDKWVLRSVLPPNLQTEAISVAYAILDGRSSGTVVVLEDMHKLDLRVGDEAHKAAYLNEEYEVIKEYLSLVFERYLSGVDLRRSDGTAVSRAVEISFNGPQELLQPLDPFLRDMEDGTRTGTLRVHRTIPLGVDGFTHLIEATIWITPKEIDRPSGYDKRIRTASRDLSIREMQGFYFYRNGRLIDFPGWKKMLRIEEHCTCLRWEIEFPSSADHLFQLDPSKREIDLPAVLRTPLSKFMAEKRRYHNDDEKELGHRKRARNRQSGKDTPPSQINNANQGRTNPRTDLKPSKPPEEIVSPTTPRSRPKAPRPLKRVRIKSMKGSLLGNLIVNEKREGETWVVTLNEAHSMYEMFRDSMREG